MSKKTKKIKKRIKAIIIGFILLLIILFSIYYYFIIYKKGVNYKTRIVIEIGDVVPDVSDYVSSDDLDRVGGSIVWEKLETTVEGNIFEVGEYFGTIDFNDEKLKVKLVVKDTKAPVIEGYKNLEMFAYEIEPDMLEGITANDNSGEDIVVKLEGEYNTEVTGEYVLSYVAEDSSGNVVREKFKLVVKENENVKISKTSKGNTIKYYYGLTYIDNVLVVNKTYGLPSTFAPNNLKAINGYIKVVDYVYDAFVNLTSDSASLGLNIYASSGYRSYGDQKYIYNNYVSWDGQENADTYSARAGHSEHQTGLAIDVNTVDSSFEGTDESNWLKDNCYKYGFIIRYPKGKDNITGYMYEPWHIRYVGVDLATILYNDGNWITMEEYYGIDSKYS